MSSASLDQPGVAGIAERLAARVGEHGTAAHPYSSSEPLFRGAEAARNLCDAVHLLCALHGRYPGVVDHASYRCLEPAARQWLGRAVQAFAVERALLTRLAVAAGPVPGTPGSAGTEAAMLGQRHALETLAQSERKGCALGAALALALDWAGVRLVLDAAAARFGVEAAGYGAGEAAVLLDVAETLADMPSVERAMLFGAEQVAIQHYGLWDLLEARQQARLGL